MANTDRPPRRSLARVLWGWWQSLLAEHAEPGQLGWGVAVGVLVGCSPLFGLQTALAVGLAWLLRLNRIAVLLGAQISIPPLTVLVVFLDAQCGELVRHQRLLPLTLSGLRAMPRSELLRSLLADLAVGGLVVGGVLGALLGVLTARVMRARRNRPRPPALAEPLLDELERRAAGLSPRDRSYLWWKVRLDPVYPLVLTHLQAASALLDLGAGMGLVSVLHCLQRPDGRAEAVEWDPGKVERGRRLAEGLPVTFVQADAFALELGTFDAIALVDVLHYVDPPAQRSMIERCARSLPAGGVLIIRDLSRRGSVAEAVERLAVRWGWNRAAAVHPLGAAELTGIVTSLGMAPEVQAAGRGPFRSNVLLVARKGGS